MNRCIQWAQGFSTIMSNTHSNKIFAAQNVVERRFTAVQGLFVTGVIKSITMYCFF